MSIDVFKKYYVEEKTKLDEKITNFNNDLVKENNPFIK